MDEHKALLRKRAIALLNDLRSRGELRDDHALTVIERHLDDMWNAGASFGAAVEAETMGEYL